MVSSSRPLAPKLSRSMRHTVLPTLQLRPASTSSNSGVVAVAEPTSTPVESSVPAPVNQASDLATELNLFDIPEVPEQIGFLKELGLDYGWGPTATVEWILEHIYIYSGLPWWATIIATTAFLRMAMFSLSKNAIETGTRMRFMNPYIQPIKAKLEAARASKDRTAMLEAQQEMSQLYTRSSIKPQSLFYPMIQIPFAYGSFRLVRGMSTLPVPGMEAGGILWFSDLSLADPYFLLPAMTSGVMYLTFKVSMICITLRLR
jgi:YidC/Oxa1 family membrane protein insertase